MNFQARILTAVALSAAALSAVAADYEDYARVLNVEPQYEQVNHPHQECRTEYVPVQREAERGMGGSIVGGVAGGILGNQVGKGNGRTVATAAGAIVARLPVIG